MGAVKVKEVNLERGSPLADVAVRNMVNQLSTCKAMGYRAVILIHGYGSTGTGGAIKAAVKSKLKDPSLKGIIRSVCSGEEWIDKRKEYTDICPQLRDFQVRVEGNKGVTVVMLK